jgi:predicted permease
MSWMRAWFSRLGGLAGKDRREKDLSEEMDSHLQLHIDDNLRAGMSPAQARREAIMKLGGVEQTKENYRERRGLPLLETLAQDLHYAFRLLIKNPGFTLVAVLTLALGIGANTAIFSFVNSVLLRPLSFRNPEQLYVINEIVPEWAKSFPILAANLPDFLIWQKECHSFEQVAVAESEELGLSGSRDAEEIRGIRASANLLDLLGEHPALGRSFRPDEDQAGHDLVVILTDSFWRGRFHADPNLLGRTIILDGQPHLVVGILPPSFHFPMQIGASGTFGAGLDFLKPLGGPRFYEQDPISEFDFAAIARLKPGVAPAKALAELNVVQAEIAKQANENLGLSAVMFPLEQQVVGSARRGLILLFAAVTAVLLIICVNLANLLLARAPARMRETAIRMALGGGRSRLLRQLLTETFLLALVGGICGIALAYFGVGWLTTLAPSDLPRVDEVAVDGRVLFFAVAISALVGTLFGILPAWRLSHADPQATLKAGSIATSEGRRSRQIRESLVAVEVGLCTALLILAGLLTSSLFHVFRVNPGFAVERILAADVDLPPQSYAQVSSLAHFYDQVLANIQAMPGVESAGWVNLLPLEGQGSVTGITLPGAQPNSTGELHANYRAVSSNYFQTVAIPLVAGRSFALDDRGKKRVILSKTLADRLWPGQNPVGRECIAAWGSLLRSEVTGVVGDIRTVNLEAPPQLMVYVPDSYGQQTPGAPQSASIVVRTSANPDSIAGAVRSVIQNADPTVPILALRPMARVVSQTVEARRFQMSLAGVFALCALLLASCGIYGVVSYNVQRRRFELGLRLALGAQPTGLFRLILRQGLTPVVLGLFTGIAVAAAGARLIQNLLFGVGAFDPITFISVAVIVASVAAAACYIPARRAMSVDPVVALRYE